MADNVTIPRLVPGVTGLSTSEAARVAAYLSAGTSTSTRRAYRGAWERWAAWCAARSLAPLAPAVDQLAAYLAQLADQGRHPSTIAVALSAISAAHRAADLPSPRDHPAIRAVVRGIRRTVGTAPRRQAPPLLLEDLAAVLPRGPDVRAVRDRALLLVGWAAALRRSELVALDVADLHTRSQGIVITIRRGKTDVEAAGAEIGIPYGRRRGLCAVAALVDWLAFVGPSGPVFRSVDRWGNIGGRLSDRAVSEIVGERADSAGLLGGFSGHSLRSGFATSAAAAGVTERSIMRQTRHRSLTVLRGYIREGSVFLDNAAGAVL